MTRSIAANLANLMNRLQVLFTSLQAEEDAHGTHILYINSATTREEVNDVWGSL